MDRAKTLILGMGSPILGDDCVGVEVANRIRENVDEDSVDVVEVSASGLELLDVICGYDRLIVIDSINTEQGKVGELHRLERSDLDFAVSPSPRHQVNLPTTLEVGRRLHMEVPEAIAIYAIEIKDATIFREGCTPEVERAIPGIVETIIEEEKLRAL